MSVNSYKLNRFVKAFISGDIENGVYSREFDLLNVGGNRFRAAIAEPNVIELEFDHSHVGDNMSPKVRIDVIDKQTVLTVLSADGDDVCVIPDWEVTEYTVPKYQDIGTVVTTKKSLLAVIYRDIQDGISYVPIPRKTYFFAHIKRSEWVHGVYAKTYVNEKNPCCYEMLGVSPSKMYIDIDYIAIEDLFEGLIEVIDHVRTLFMSEYNETLSDDQFQVLRSFPDKGLGDASIHIIVNSAKSFADPVAVRDLLKKYKMFAGLKLQLDKNVYKMWQKFRIAESPKSDNDQRVFKRVAWDSAEALDKPIEFDIAATLIQNYNETYPFTVGDEVIDDPHGRFTNQVPLTDDEWKSFTNTVTEIFETRLLREWSTSMTRTLGGYLRNVENSVRMYEFFVETVERVLEQKTIGNERIIAHPMEQKTMGSSPLKADRPWMSAKRAVMPLAQTYEFIRALFVNGVTLKDFMLTMDFDLSYNSGEYISTLDRKNQVNHCRSYGMTLHQNAGPSYTLVINLKNNKDIILMANGTEVARANSHLIINAFVSGSNFYYGVMSKKQCFVTTCGPKVHFSIQFSIESVKQSVPKTLMDRLKDPNRVDVMKTIFAFNGTDE